MEKIILGIDPGTNIMGYGLIKVKDNKAEMITMGIIDLRKFGDSYLKLGHIFERVTGIIDSYLPDEMAIEELFFNTNQKTAIAVAEARGVILLAARKRGVSISEYTPLQIKQALVGYGRADKKQVQSMVKAILNLEKVPKPDDTADALAAAICHGHSAGSSRLRQLMEMK